MKPHTPKKNRAASLSHVKSIINIKLGWLQGFPLNINPNEKGIVWALNDYQKTIITIDREKLSKSTYTIIKARADFPHALPRLVGDPDLWVKRLRSILDLLKPAIHFNQPIPLNLFKLNELYPEKTQKISEKLQSDNPAFAPVINRLSWVYCTTPHKADNTLNWLRKKIKKFSVIIKNFTEETSIDCIFNLIDLFNKEGENRIEYLLNRFGDHKIYKVPLLSPNINNQYIRDFEQLLGRKRKIKTLKLPYSESYGKQLNNHCSWLSGQTKIIRNKSIQLLELTEPIDLIEQWQQWWKSNKLLLNQTYSCQNNIPLTKETRKNLQYKLKKNIKTIPVYFNSEYFIKIIEQSASHTDNSQHKDICKMLSLIPRSQKDIPSRIMFLNEWNNILSDNWADNQIRNTFINYLSGLSFYFRKQKQIPFKVSLNPWHDLINYWQQDCYYESSPFTDDIIYEEISSKQIILLFAALAQIIKCLKDNEPNNDYSIDVLIKLVKISDDIQWITSTFQKMMKHDILNLDFDSDLLKTAYLLINQSDQTFSLNEIIINLTKNDEQRDLHFDKISRLQEIFCKDGYPNLMAAMILKGRTKQINIISKQIAVLTKKGITIPALSPQPEIKIIPDWIKKFPESIHKLLCHLNKVSRNAEKTAEKILEKDFPSKKKLENELIHLNKKAIDNSSLNKRILNLQQRLSAAPRISPGRMENLSLKINRAISRILFDTFAAETKVLWQNCLAKITGFSQQPDWLMTMETAEIILAFNELPKSENQTLARQLLKERLKEPPWDLRNEPANKKFIQSLEQNRINMKPWLNGIGEIICRDDKKQNIHLSFAEDPLDIFFMGAHFNTCLSPGNCNFFSVVANAADINKRIIYGKTANGTVVGRCLIGLTAQGSILTFHPYSHIAGNQFAEMVKIFITELSRQMNTIPAPNGKIQRLLSIEWYDDGPTDLTETFHFLEENSTFRNSLAEMNPENFINKLEQLFSPLPLNALTIPLVACLPEISINITLASVLLDKIEKTPGIPDSIISHLAILLSKIESPKRIFIRFKEQIINNILIKYQSKYQHHSEKEELYFLTQANPLTALKLMRKMRKIHYRTWEDCIDGTLIFFSAEAKKALRRPKQALKLYKQVLNKNMNISQEIIEQAEYNIIQLNNNI
jgi:hypothetical protein